MRPLRVGIAGAGWVAAARHLPSYRRLPEVEVVAVYDSTPERARRLAEDLPGTTVITDNLDRFLAEGLDIVSIASSPWSHCELSVRASDAGAHVFTEKPMAMHGAQARQMVEAASRAGRLLAVSHNFLRSRAMHEARALLAARPVDYVTGLQLSAESRRLPTWYRSLPGGLMFDEAPHLVYTLNDLLGGELRLDHVRGELTEGQPRSVELLVAGRTGRGQVTMVFDSPVSEWHVMASSSGGLVMLDLFRDIAIRVGPDGAHKAGDIARTSASVLGGHVRGFAKAGGRLVRGRQYWGHDELIADFVAAVRSGGVSPVPVDDALAVVDFTDDVLAGLGIVASTERR